MDHIWTECNTGGTPGVDKPTARYCHAMAYAGSSKLIIFGGYNGGLLGDTWEYNVTNHTWTQYNTDGTPDINKPGPRFYHTLTYAGGSKLILFGGYNGGMLGDTWEYDVNNHTWVQYNTGGIPGTDKPIIKYSHAMAYAGGSKLILFGGSNGNNLGDTWEYDASNHSWTQFNTGGTPGIDKPVSRFVHTMAYAGGSKLILFAGYNSSSLGDTWEYDVLNHIWTQYNTGGTSGIDKPIGRICHAMSYAGGSKIILFGGTYSSGRQQDTWEYDDSNYTWTEYNKTGTKPGIRENHSLSYAGGMILILFGGYNSGNLGDTWEYR